MMFQRAGSVQRDETGDRPRGDFMRQSRGGKQRGVRPGDVLDDEETEELRRHRQRRRRDDQPAGKNRDDRLAEFLVKGVKLKTERGRRSRCASSRSALRRFLPKAFSTTVARADFLVERDGFRTRDISRRTA